MKAKEDVMKGLKGILCFALVAATLFTASCTKSKGYERARIAPVVAYAETSVTAVEMGEESYFAFTSELIKQVYNGNTIVAPLSTFSAIGMAANGAAGQTLEEIEHAVGEIEGVNAYCLSARERINKASDEAKASVVSSVWIRDEFEQYVKDDYLHSVSSYYGPEIFSLPFNKSALKRINNWAFNNTYGMIDNVVEGFKQNAAMEIISASAVKGKWLDQAKKTRSGEFFAADGRTTTAEYFSGKSSLFASESAYAVRRYMKNGFYLMAVMPNGEIGDYVSSLTAEELYMLFGNEDPRGASYIMPEFEIEQNTSLVPALKDMGMSLAFDEYYADFTKMSSYPYGLYITDVNQNAKIEVTKNGLEAAATIKISLGGKATAAPDGEPLYIEFNKPFVYLVCYEKVPIFAGVVNNI